MTDVCPLQVENYYGQLVTFEAVAARRAGTAEEGELPRSWVTDNNLPHHRKPHGACCMTAYY